METFCFSLKRIRVGTTATSERGRKLIICLKAAEDLFVSHPFSVFFSSICQVSSVPKEQLSAENNTCVLRDARDGERLSTFLSELPADQSRRSSPQTLYKTWRNHTAFQETSWLVFFCFFFRLYFSNKGDVTHLHHTVAVRFDWGKKTTLLGF